VYRCVVVTCAWPASSWIARGAAPRIARCEQKVYRRRCGPLPSTFAPFFESGSVSTIAAGQIAAWDLGFRIPRLAEWSRRTAAGAHFPTIRIVSTVCRLPDGGG
jgi:hypothetical protein